MRTTLDIAEDVLLAVKQRARQEKRTAGEVLSEVARQGLTRDRFLGAESGDDFFGFSPLPHRGGAISNALIDRLREEDLD